MPLQLTERLPAQYTRSLSSLAHRSAAEVKDDGHLRWLKSRRVGGLDVGLYLLSVAACETTLPAHKLAEMNLEFVVDPVIARGVQLSSVLAIFERADIWAEVSKNVSSIRRMKRMRQLSLVVLYQKWTVILPRLSIVQRFL